LQCPFDGCPVAPGPPAKKTPLTKIPDDHQLFRYLERVTMGICSGNLLKSRCALLRPRQPR